MPNQQPILSFTARVLSAAPPLQQCTLHHKKSEICSLKHKISIIPKQTLYLLLLLLLVDPQRVAGTTKSPPEVVFPAIRHYSPGQQCNGCCGQVLLLPKNNQIQIETRAGEQQRHQFHARPEIRGTKW